MTKRMTLVLALLLAAAMLCGCQSEQQDTGRRYDVVTNANQMSSNTQQQQVAFPLTETVVTDAPVYESYTDYGSDDTWSYTDYGYQEDSYTSLSLQPTAAPTVRGVYAGATPVVIDPIDKPTPTPLPQLQFENAVYDATKIHLSFQAPAGWSINEAASDTYMITNPNSSMDYAASLTIRVTKVNADMSENEMKAEVKNMMNTLKTAFYKFEPTNTASRTLLDKNGIYADYKATMADGTEVAGRVHVTCFDKTMYELHVSYPKGYTETYKSALYDVFRHSVKITK